MRITDTSRLQKKYDVVIVGSGIAGLTCGAYLAKSGLKVLIAEYHTVPGGFCTSFKRGEFIYDIGVHYLGNISDTGVMGRLIKDFDLSSELQFIRINPNDFVVMSDKKVSFTNNFNETVHNLRSAFPDSSREIQEYCQLLNNDNFLVLYKSFRNKTFRQSLDESFSREDIKSFFSIMLGNIGLPSTEVSALTAAVMYRDYIFRGGYYPKGGMQRFPDALTKRYIEFGGDIILNNAVTQISIHNNRVKYVVLDGKMVINTDFVVSNCSAMQTFKELMKDEYLPPALERKLQTMIPSPSAFIVYFSLKGDLSDSEVHSNTWYCPSHGIDEVYEASMKGRVRASNFLFVSLASLHDNSLCPRGYHVGHLIVLAPYMSDVFWAKNKMIVAEKMINVANRIVPGFTSKLHKTYLATPQTVTKYTKADRGSIYGWASTPDQVGHVMASETHISNLFLAGHWTTLETGQGGVTMAALSGRSVSKAITAKMCSKPTSSQLSNMTK